MVSTADTAPPTPQTLPTDVFGTGTLIVVDLSYAFRPTVASAFLKSVPITRQYAQQIGVTVAVLYIPYQPIFAPNPSFAGDKDDKVNDLVPSIPQNLPSCASPGFFFTANSAADINNAMQAMFAQALQAARLTQ